MTARPGDRLVPALLAVCIAVVSAGAGAGAYALTAPEPKPIVRTLDVPPACLEIRSVFQAERAKAEEVSAAERAAEQEAAGRYEAELTKNEDKISDAANRLDTANRASQKARLEFSAAQVATDAAVNKCTPERPE